jgi:hypothetical protein
MPQVVNQAYRVFSGGGPLLHSTQVAPHLTRAATARAHAAAHGAQMSCPLLLELVELPTELHTGMTQLAATYTRRVFLRRVPLDLTHPPHAEEADSGRGAAVAALDGVDGLVMAEEGGACGLDVAGDVLDAAEPGSQVCERESWWLGFRVPVPSATHRP